jgi:hypothetical protein
MIPRKDDTAATDHDKIIRLEANHENLETNVLRFIEETRETCSRIEKKIDDFTKPTRKKDSVAPRSINMFQSLPDWAKLIIALALLKGGEMGGGKLLSLFGIG